MSINKVELSGNIVKDAGVYQTQSGADYLRFTLAVNDYYSGENHTQYINCVYFGQRGVSQEPYFKKGLQLFIVGKIDYRTWKDEEDNYQSSTRVIVENHDYGKAPNDSAGSKSSENDVVSTLQNAGASEIKVNDYSGDCIPF